MVTLLANWAAKANWSRPWISTADLLVCSDWWSYINLDFYIVSRGVFTIYHRLTIHFIFTLQLVMGWMSTNGWKQREKDERSSRSCSVRVHHLRSASIKIKIKKHSAKLLLLLNCLSVSRELSRLEREQRARSYYEQQLQERRKKLLEQRLKEERRRAAVEEKRKQRLREEKVSFSSRHFFIRT